MSAAVQALITDLDKSLLLALSQSGPQFAADLAARLGLETRQVTYRMIQLRRRGFVSQEARRYNRRRHKNFLWAIMPDVDVPSLETSLPEPGITTEDLAWMAYWQQPRAVRRQQAARHHAV